MRSFSDHCAFLGCPLTNARWSWCAISPDSKRAVFTLWADEIKNRQFTLYPASERRPREIPEAANYKLGAVESERIANEVAVNQAIEALGILCFTQDPKAASRERTDFDDKTVFRLRVEKANDQIIAHLTERISVSSIA